ncbi:MAG: flagellar hook-associated protein FlgL [Burkholderiaceae bacterium]|nr:flagellar hook-associated protein FlgL [Burkholderiaceae bacterium]
MRISSNLLFQTGLNSMNAQQSDLMHLYQQIGSGQRMVTPSDDPLAAAQAINLSQSQAQNARFNENRSVAMQNLGVEDNTLSSVVTLMQNIKTTMIEAGNGTMSDADRMTLSTVLTSARDTLLGLANSTDGNGQYLFSGSRGDVVPFDNNGNYQGDARQRNIQIDQTRQLSSSDIGSDVFSRVSPGSNSYLTGAAGTNGGTGVIGTPAIINAGEVKKGYTFEVVFTSDTEYRIIPTSNNADPAAPVPLIIPGVINPDDKSGQLLIPGYGLQVKFSGQPVAGDSFTIEPAESTDMNVFQTMQNMIDALAGAQGAGSAEDQAKAQANFQNVLANSMQRMDLNYDNVLTVQSSVGTRMNEIDAVKANGALRHVGVTGELSRLEDLDYYTTTAQLQLRNSALQAAMMAFVKIQQTTLLNIGR